MHRKRRSQHISEMTQFRYRFTRELLMSQIEIQEEKFRHIIDEIHDNIGQVLSLAKLQLNTLPQISVDQNLAVIEHSKRLLTKAITDLRGLSKNLQPEQGDIPGLEEKISQQLEILGKTNLFKTKLQINGSMYKLPPEHQTILFRIVQEALNNIMRYSGAGKVDVVLDYEAKGVILSITDDGRARDIVRHRSITKREISLRNIKKRTSLIGAEFAIYADSSKGTSIIINLPVTDSKLRPSNERDLSN